MTTQIKGSATSTFGGNVVIPSPAFDAYSTANQSISSSTWTKVILGGEFYDLTNHFDSTTNYRFQPNIEGYYQINTTVRFSNGGALAQLIIGIFKNGTFHKTMTNLRDVVSNSPMHICGSNLVYMNGTTDYVELYTYLNATSPLLLSDNASDANCSMNGFLARAV